MRAFGFARPDSVTGAIGTLDDDAKYLAGGTNLVDLMKLGVETPATLIDVRHLLSTEVVGTDSGGVRVGAGASNSDVAANALVRKQYPALSQALLMGASGQLRNMATVGGNLLQRTRCLYFTDVSKPCNKRQAGSGCPAREGEHHNLAVLGASERCIATHPSDMAVALAAFDALVHFETADGPGTLALADLYANSDPQVETNLPAGALITAVELPPVGLPSSYRKVRERASYAFAIASVAAALEVVDGAVRDVRLAFGAVAPRPWRARTAESVLRGRPFDLAEVREAVAQEFAAATPLRDNAYKIELSTNIAVQALAELAGSSAGTETA